MSALSSTPLLDLAVHHYPLISKRGLLERLFTFWFNSLVYNQIWEDPRVDLAALQLVPDESRLVTISSGGCNVLNYLLDRPATIAAVDLNSAHLALLRLKLAALRHLPGHAEFFLFFACANDPANRENYHTHLSQHLEAGTRNFWEGGSWLRRRFWGRRIDYFTKNFYDYAKLGYFLRFLHLIAAAQRCNPARILSAATPEEQEALFQEEIAPAFDHWLIRAADHLSVLLFSMGIPPQQFRAMQADAPEETGGGGMPALMRARVHRLACGTPIAENYFAWQAFSRSYDCGKRRALPDYLKAENFSALRGRANRVSTLRDFVSRISSRATARARSIALSCSMLRTGCGLRKSDRSGARSREWAVQARALFSALPRAARPSRKRFHQRCGPASTTRSHFHRSCSPRIGRRFTAASTFTPSSRHSEPLGPFQRDKRRRQASSTVCSTARPSTISCVERDIEQCESSGKSSITYL